MIELKARLAAIAAYVPQGSIVIDVGTDHAYLPIFLLQQKICARAVGIDIHQGPYQSALAQVEQQCLSDRITLYLGDGLKPLKPGEGNLVVAAGMGGTTIKEVLEARPDVLAQVQRLILQPMVAGAALRRWLLENGWAIVAERLVEEDERIYEIIVAEPGSQPVPVDILLELGPLIVAAQDSLLPPLIAGKVEALEEVLRQLNKTERPDAVDKRQEILRKISELKGIL
ncbi:MAG: class I SAM-dependent methyltransferase [Peptococcaceae bacterium]|nr:class I SAM-dependent methyltransferase [Peptococcaceae bacterium]